VEVVQELLAAFWRSSANFRTKGAGSWIAAEVSFGEEDDVDILGRGRF
jgi:hypothetical protein